MLCCAVLWSLDKNKTHSARDWIRVEDSRLDLDKFEVTDIIQTSNSCLDSRATSPRLPWNIDTQYRVPAYPTTRPCASFTSATLTFSVFLSANGVKDGTVRCTVYLYGGVRCTKHSSTVHSTFQVRSLYDIHISIRVASCNVKSNHVY